MHNDRVLCELETDFVYLISMKVNIHSHAMTQAPASHRGGLGSVPD